MEERVNRSHNREFRNRADEKWERNDSWGWGGERIGDWVMNERCWACGVRKLGRRVKGILNWALPLLCF